MLVHAHTVCDVGIIVQEHSRSLLESTSGFFQGLLEVCCPVLHWSYCFTLLSRTL